MRGERCAIFDFVNLVLRAIPIFLSHLIEYSTFGFGDFAEAFDNFIQFDSIDIEFVC